MLPWEYKLTYIDILIALLWEVKRRMNERSLQTEAEENNPESTTAQARTQFLFTPDGLRLSDIIWDNYVSRLGLKLADAKIWKNRYQQLQIPNPKKCVRRHNTLQS